MPIRKAVREAIFKRDNNMCLLCNARFNLTIDHIIPLSKGGTNYYTNLQTLCHSCNLNKGCSNNRNYIDYRKNKSSRALRDISRAHVPEKKTVRKFHK